MGPDEKMRERLKEELVRKALDRGIPIEEIERMYNVTFVKIPKTNKDKHSYSETTYYGNERKVTITVIEQLKVGFLMTSDNELRIMSFLRKNPFLFGEKALCNESLVSLYTECVEMLPIFESEGWYTSVLTRRISSLREEIVYRLSLTETARTE